MTPGRRPTSEGPSRRVHLPVQSVSVDESWAAFYRLFELPVVHDSVRYHQSGDQDSDPDPPARVVTDRPRAELLRRAAQA